MRQSRVYGRAMSLFALKENKPTSVEDNASSARNNLAGGRGRRR